MKRILYLAPLALWLSGCGQSPRENKQAAPGPVVAVHVVAARQRQWPSVYEASGTVRARATSDIAAKLMGYVREVKVQTGDHIQAGQLLVTLDTRDLDVNTRRAEAALEEVRSAVAEAESAIAGARSNLDLAQSTFNRMQDLFNNKSISNQEFDQAAAKLKSAQSGYDMAKAKRQQLDAQAAKAQQDVKASEVTRTYAELTAPFSGLITAKSVEPGTLAVPGTPLLTMERDGAYRLEASVEESRLASIRVGQSVSVTLHGIDRDGIDRTISARVAEIVPGVDAASRSATVKLDLPVIASLRAGMFGRASFQQGSRSVLVIPASAITERGQLQSVFITDNGTARTRLITTGQRNQDQVEVLSGITAGESIIVPVPTDLSDGARVEVRP